MGPNEYSTTAREDIIKSLQTIPPDAALTLDQLTRNTDKARETIRGAARQLTTERLIEKIPVEGVSAYRLSAAPLPARQRPHKKKRVQNTPANRPDTNELAAELRSLYDEKLRLELQINDVERRLVEVGTT
jgi:hypothetical protein